MTSCSAAVEQYTHVAQHCAGTLPMTGFEVFILIGFAISILLVGLWIRHKNW